MNGLFSSLNQRSPRLMMPMEGFARESEPAGDIF